MSLFGQALRDLYRKESKGDFYVCTQSKEYPLDLEFYLTDRPEPCEAEMLEYVKGRIVDIGCGTGRIMKFLTQKGHDVTGFDIDAEVVVLCKEQGIPNVYEESYDNMEKFGKFDTLLLLNRTIGIGGNLSGVRALLKKCHTCCTDNGILIFDSWEVEPEKATGPPGVLETKLRYKYDDVYGEWFPWIHISSEAIENLLVDTGWSRHKIAKDEDHYCMLCARTHNTPTLKDIP
ncbi:MAG: methyltransferase domain-containing protein [Candidatus Coatesbacteria bacterium]|nr:MAG: methyltransferase domain-containing protein [Candidatus Coatesbacteria bacterium]